MWQTISSSGYSSIICTLGIPPCFFFFVKESSRTGGSPFREPALEFPNKGLLALEFSCFYFFRFLSSPKAPPLMSISPYSWWTSSSFGRICSLKRFFLGGSSFFADFGWVLGCGKNGTSSLLSYGCSDAEEFILPLRSSCCWAGLRKLLLD